MFCLILKTSLRNNIENEWCSCNFTSKRVRFNGMAMTRYIFSVEREFKQTTSWIELQLLRCKKINVCKLFSVHDCHGTELVELADAVNTIVQGPKRKREWKPLVKISAVKRIPWYLTHSGDVLGGKFGRNALCARYYQEMSISCKTTQKNSWNTEQFRQTCLSYNRSI